MANTLLTPTMVTRRALAILHQKLVFLRTISRQYDDQFARSGAKIGNTLKIRKPNQYTVRTGLVMSAQDTVEESLDLVVSTVKGVDVNFDSVELTLDIDDFAKRILEPAMARLASEVEAVVLENVYLDVYNHVGTGASNPNTFLQVLNANVKLSQGLAPDTTNRHLLLDPVIMATMVDALKGFFHRASDVERAFSEAYYGRAAGLNWWETTAVPNHTNGTRTDTTPVINTSTGITSGSASLTVTGAGNALVYETGDVFTIDDVFAVNPETKRRYSHLQQFTVTADATSTAGGAVTLTVSPTPTTSGARQNVELVSAGAGKAILNLTGGGSGAADEVFAQQLAYHRDAFTFVTADLEVPRNTEASRQVYDGISLRYVRDFDIINSKHPARFDVLFGYKTIRPEWATRLAKQS